MGLSLVLKNAECRLWVELFQHGIGHKPNDNQDKNHIHIGLSTGDCTDFVSLGVD